MTDPNTFIDELDAKNRVSIDRIVAGFVAALDAESFTIPDLLKIDLKLVIEAAEVAALWITDCEDLDLKLSLAVQCGDGAKHYDLLRRRLAALGLDLEGFDPRQGGYSKLFAFFRSLQTAEERASAGQLTLKAMSMARSRAVASWCSRQEDLETAQLYDPGFVEDERKQFECGRRTLRRSALNEESQARARRAAYRTLELLGELYEPAALRKLARSVRPR